MPIKTNDRYDKLCAIWQKCRAVCGGDDDLKAWGGISKAVPKLPSQTDAEYRAMLNRATLFAAAGRTVEGLVGMVTRKPIDATYPASMADIIEDMTLAIDNMSSLDDLTGKLLVEDVIVGRVGLLVDRPNVDTAGMTQAQVTALNLRPFVTEYPAESILDWRFDRVNNAAQLVMVRLKECVYEWTTDIDRKEIEQERRLLLENGAYIQRIYREVKGGNKKQEWVQIGPDIVPMMNGAPLPYIPFVCDFECEKPPILDLVNVNLSHFRTDVDREHGAHFTAVPTPMFAGFTFAKGEAFNLGASGGYAATDPNAKWGFLEFTGTGLGTLREIKEEKAEQMAVLGARFLTSEKAAAEAEATVKIRRSGETSVIAKIAHKRDEAMERVLEIMRDWMGLEGDVEVELNTDFTDSSLSAQDLTALVSSYQQGAISFQTFYWNMSQGEMYAPDTTLEGEQEAIQSQTIGDSLLNSSLSAQDTLMQNEVAPVVSE